MDIMYKHATGICEHCGVQEAVEQDFLSVQGIDKRDRHQV